jgi:ubiquinone/menaquinone biosynthesis C-methylase UbiE
LTFSGLTPESVRKFYDRFGSLQDLQAVYEDRALKTLTQHSSFENAESVLELGCGTGRLAKRLFEEELGPDCHYRGLDISQTMVYLARNRLLPWETRVDIDRVDGTRGVALPDRSIDRFLATYVFDLLSPEAIQHVLHEAHRLLRDHGLLSVVSLTEGATLASRGLTALWKAVWTRKPGLMGGCRPVLLAEHLDPRCWRIESHQSLVAMGLLTSEWVVATPIR